MHTKSEDYDFTIKSWKTKSKEKAIVLAVHGYNDYSNSFKIPATHLSKFGISTYTFDLRGFGKNKDRGEKSILIQVAAFNDFRNAKQLTSKLNDFKAYIQREFIFDKYFYRVRIGPFSESNYALDTIRKLTKLGIKNSKIITDYVK